VSPLTLLFSEMGIGSGIDIFPCVKDGTMFASSFGFL
jgi:hypothetical protein